MQRAAWHAGYDPATRQVVVFAGTGTSSRAQAWTWTGSTWRRLHPVHSPRYRKYGSMAHDGALHELVLYGGVNISGIRPGSVWGWTGRTWRLIGCRSWRLRFLAPDRLNGPAVAAGPLTQGAAASRSRRMPITCVVNGQS